MHVPPSGRLFPKIRAHVQTAQPNAILPVLYSSCVSVTLGLFQAVDIDDSLCYYQQRTNAHKLSPK